MTTTNARLGALTHDALLKRNVILNLAAWAIPAAAALLSIPLLTRSLGAARFGLVAIAWATVGMFSLFDFGLGRAVTRLVAERLATGRDEEIPDLVWTMSWTLLALTGVIALVGVLGAAVVARRVLDVPPELAGEAVGVVVLLALSVPALAHGVALRGVLEGAQQFGAINRLRVPLGLMTYGGPLLALLFGGDTRVAVGAVVLGRVLYWIAHFPMLDLVVPGLQRAHRPSKVAFGELLRVGGWIGLSSLISPALVYLDRVVIAAMLPIAASGSYGVASEVATKQWLFTAALQPVFFSAMAAAILPDPARAAELMERAARITMLALLPAALALVLFAEPLLQVWMGPAYAPDAATALRWLAIAVYVNAAAQVPYSVLQGGVDERLPAIFHMIELPLYAGALYLLARGWGLPGVAMAWCLRMSVDGLAMWIGTAWRFPAGRRPAARLAWIGGACVAVIATAAWAGARLW